MNTESKTVNRLFWAIAGAVALIALGSFVWSFIALKELAEANSSQTGLGWIWPLITDLSMVIYTGGILIAQIQRRPARLPIGLTIFYSLVTIAGNVLHAPGTPLGWFVAIMPPLSLIFGTEMLRSMGHHIIERGAALSTLAELMSQADQARADLAAILSTKQETLDKLNGQIERAQQRLGDIKAGQIGEISANVHELNAARQAKIEERRAAVLSLLGQGMEERDIASRLEVNIKTIRRDIKNLNGAAQSARGLTQ